MKRRVPHQAPDHDMRDQEVVRANKELAAYFKGRRTEREARAALKIIKAFVRQREREGQKRPLPGMPPAERAKPAQTRTRRKRSQPAKRLPMPPESGTSEQPDE